MESMTVEEVKSQLEYTEKNGVRQTLNNYVKVLKLDPVLKGRFRKNLFTGMTDVVGNVEWHRDSTSIEDVDLTNTLIYVEAVYGLKNENTLEKAIRSVANDDNFHPIIDYLSALKWDGVPRIRGCLHKFLGANEDDYTYEALRLFMLGAIHRIHRPGCKFEYMLCLAGGQGAGKSTFLRFLAIKDEWFTDDLSKLGDDNVYRKLQGHYIIEMSEMLATGSAKSVEEIKSFISRQKETYKVPYDRYPKDRHRQCVFAGTSNTLDFLPFDRTGNRRFIPVLCDSSKAEVHILADESSSRAYIEQMWAEAMEIYRSGNFELKISPAMQKYLEEHLKDFMPEDTMAGEIQGWLDDYEGDLVCTKMIAEECLELRDAPKFKLREVADVMRNSIVGWVATQKTHRFAVYGPQKAWERVEHKADANGFMPIPEQMELPFD